MHDFLLENSIMYKELVREGELKGLREGELKGFEQGRTQGRDAGMRQSIEAVVQTRFPALLDLTKERIKGLHNPDTLQMVLVALVSASTENNARSYLLTLHADQ